MKQISREALNLVYPQTNNNWANEVGITFTADEADLDKDGWLDPWSRPLDKNNLSGVKYINKTFSCRYTKVFVGPIEDDCHTIELEICKML